MINTYLHYYTLSYRWERRSTAGNTYSSDVGYEGDTQGGLIYIPEAAVRDDE